MFQSLCRGTAFATVMDATMYAFPKRCFNPSVEGQPLQRCRVEFRDEMVKVVSIPLSRDSLCNMAKTA